jgi:hypothetical protein
MQRVLHAAAFHAMSINNGVENSLRVQTSALIQDQQVRVCPKIRGITEHFLDSKRCAELSGVTA